jgi:hypothetical protein
MTDWQNAVESADEAKTGVQISPQLATANAYPIGQIIYGYVRKEPGSWNPEKGVK